MWQKLSVTLTVIAALGLMSGMLFLFPAQQVVWSADGVGGPAEDLALDAPSSAWSALVDIQPQYGVPEPPDALTAAAGRSSILTIGRNQTFYEALRAAGVPHGDIMALVKTCKRYRNLKRVRHGDVFHLGQNEDGSVQSLSFDLDLESYLSFVRDGEEFSVLERTHPVERRICAVSGDIQSSLYASLKTADAPLSLASKINDILGWEIDFSRDLRRGDTFRILYEEIWKDGEFVRTGPILALECINKGKPHLGFRFIGEQERPGYYDAEGNNLQKQLMRAPLEYSRISSGFSWRRYHPILKRYMPHMGVDYAAPVGTPVRAAGNGTVVEAGRKQGNGRYIKIRHNNRAYESYYLHLSRFASGIKRGVSVTQGQVIGYVGATGYATGPHLDYRVKKDGRFVDPRKLKLPSAAPVPAAAFTSFETLAQLYRQTLASLSPSSLPHQVTLAQAAPVPPGQPLERAMAPEAVSARN